MSLGDAHIRPAVPGDGPSSSCSIMVVGTSPGVAEESAMKPFVGPTSGVLRDIIEGQGLTESTYFTNLIPHRLGDEGRKPTKEEIDLYSSRFVEDIKRLKPDLIVTIGSTPLNFLMGQKIPSLKIVHGLILKRERFGMYLSVMPVFDPAYLARRGGLLTREGESWVEDLCSIREHLEVGIG